MHPMWSNVGFLLVDWDPTPTPKTSRSPTMRWKPALNAFAIAFTDRFPAAENY